MKRILFLLLLCITTTLVVKAQTWVNLTSSVPEEVKTSIISSDENEISFRVEVSGFLVTEIEENEIVYHRIDLPGAIRTETTGFPELPIINKMIAIPECTGITIDYNINSEQVLTGYNVYPVPDFQIISNPDSTFYTKEVFCKDTLGYSDAAFIPSSVTKIVGQGYMREQRIAEISISPLRFNPCTKQIEVITEMSITIHLQNSVGSASANVGIFNNVAAHTLLNYTSADITAEINDMRGGNGKVNCITLTDVIQSDTIEADYLIICASNMFDSVGVPASSILELARHRSKYNGFDIAILNQDNILGLDFSYPANDTVNKWEHKMRSFLKRVYEGGHAVHTYDGRLGYVLLIGRAPMYNQEEDYYNYPYSERMITGYSHRQRIQSNSDIYPSDYCLSCLNRCPINPNWPFYDPYGDVFIGRFCVDDTLELKNIVIKTIKREKQFNPRLNNILEEANGKIDTNYYRYFETQYYPLLLRQIGTNKILDTVNQWHLEIEDFQSEVLRQLNAGGSVYLMNQHGGVTEWSNLGNTVPLMDNSKTMNHFCLSYSCLTGCMDNPLKCMAQTITTKNDSIGFVGFIASGRAILQTYNYPPETYLLGKIPQAIYQHLSHITGEILLESLIGNDRDKFHFNLFGDPALNIMARGYEVNSPIILDAVTDISNPITIKNGGSITIPENGIVRFHDNGCISVLPSGNLIIHNNVFLDGTLANKAAIRLYGGRNITLTGSNVHFDKVLLQFKNPTFSDDPTYLINGIKLNNSTIETEAVSITFNQNEFNNRSDIISTYSILQINNSLFNKSGIVATNNATIGIPVGGSVPITTVSISNSTFNNSGTFNYQTNGNVRSVSNAAIYLEEVDDFVINKNRFNLCETGLYIKNSGSGNMGCVVSGNYMEDNYYDAIVIYNSYVDLLKDTIVGNKRRGISIYNNSMVTLGELMEPSGGYNQIEYNEGNQIYTSENAFPILFRYNKISGPKNGTDHWVFYDTEGRPYQSSLGQNVTYNNWDGNVDFDSTAVFNDYTLFDFRPFWNFMKTDKQQSDVELLYQQAVAHFGSSEYRQAQYEFRQIITNYPETQFALSALKQLFRIEQFVDDNYLSLKDYYQYDTIITSDSLLNKVAGFLSARCDVYLKNYNEALKWYISQLKNNTIMYQDSVFYFIDAGDIYLKMMEDTVFKGNGSLWQDEFFLPVDYVDYSVISDYLLSTLPKWEKNVVSNWSREGVEKEFVVFPNPVNDIVMIRGKSIDKVEAFDVLGRCLVTDKAKGKDIITINLAGFPTGIYFVKVINNDGTPTVKKIIKQ